MNRRGMVRWSANLGYLAAARHRLNLTLRSGCQVDRVLIEDGRAVGLRVDSGGELQTVRGKEIVISAGAIQSPAILLRSGIGPAGELGALGIESVVDLPGVGKRLMDHPMTPMLFRARPGVADPDKPLTQTLLRYTAEGGEFNDMQVYLLGHMQAGLRDVEGAFGIAPGVQLPNSYGEVTLASADYRDHPQIDVSFDDNEEDRRRLREGARLAWRLSQHPELAQYHDGAVDFDEATANDDDLLDAWIHDICTSMAHPTCTCAMGTDPGEGAVVDSEGRVFGVTGLRVADASIMPTLIRANTNFTSMVIGARIADWMAAD